MEFNREALVYATTVGVSVILLYLVILLIFRWEGKVIYDPFSFNSENEHDPSLEESEFDEDDLSDDF